MANLLERDGELAALDGALADARGGEGRVVAVEGPAGIGKTRLLDELRERARADRMRVLSARGHEIERDFAFGIVRQLLEPALDRPLFSGSEDEGASAGGGGSLFARLHSLYWQCAEMAQEQPLAVVVDDAQWADDESVAFLGFLARRTAELPLLLAVGTRPADGNEPQQLPALLADDAVTVLRPSTLSSDAVASLVRDVLGGSAEPEFCEACLSATQGNPFLLAELLREAAATGVAPVAAEAARVRSLGPRAVARAVLLRVARLPAAAALLAQAVAVLGDESDLRTAAALAGLDAEEAGEAASGLIRAEVLAATERLSFVHPVVRTAIYEELSPVDRAERHAAAATLLFEARRPAEQVAAHLRLAPPAGSAWAVDVLRSAASSALARGASRAAVEHLRRAFEEPPPDELRGPLTMELGAAEALVDGPAAVAHLREAMEGISDPVMRAEVSYGLGRALLFAGTPDEVVEVCTSAISSLGDRDAGLTRRLEAVLMNIALIQPELGSLALSMYSRLSASDLPDDLGGRMLEALLALHEARALVPDADPLARAERALSDGSLLVEDSGGGPLMFACFVPALADRLSASLEVLEAAVVEANRQGSMLGYVAARIFRAQALLWQGELRDAEAEARDALEGTQTHGIGVANPMFAGLWADALSLQGDLTGASEALSSAGLPAAVPTGFAFCWYLQARSRLRLLSGDRRGALADALLLGERYTGMNSVNPAVFEWRSLAALASDDGALALEEVELAWAWGAPRALGRALRMHGLVTGSVASLEESVSVLEGSPARLERAESLVALGSSMRRSGARADSRVLLRSALELATVCGAVPLAERASEELAASGARPRRVELSGPASLTRREAHVAGLAAEGMTNREIAQRLFVTEKTVETHLGNAFAKLGIRSRTQLRDALEPDAAAA